MRMYDLILKKRNGGKLNKEEIEYIVQGFINEEVKDYQMAAFLMAVYLGVWMRRKLIILQNVCVGVVI